MVSGWESGCAAEDSGGRKGREDDGAGRRPGRDVRMSLHDEGMAADSVLARCAVQWRFAGRLYKQSVNIHDSSHWLGAGAGRRSPRSAHRQAAGSIARGGPGSAPAASSSSRPTPERQAGVRANLRLAVIHHSPVSCCLLPAASPNPTPPGLYTRPFLVKLARAHVPGTAEREQKPFLATGTIDCAKPNSHHPPPFPYYYYVQQIGSFPRRQTPVPCRVPIISLSNDTACYHLPAPTVPIPHPSFRLFLPTVPIAEPQSPPGGLQPNQ